MIYRGQGEHANLYTIDVMVLLSQTMVWHLFLAWIALLKAMWATIVINQDWCLSST